jgi:hypothetical protein
MSRPKPKIEAEIINKNTYQCDQVLSAEGIWAVFFDNSPINLKSFNSLTNYPGPKYKKVSFSNPGHAINLAKKLNTHYKSNSFSVVLLRQGETIFPNEK